MPPVGPNAGVLQFQAAGPSPRGRLAEARQSASHFSSLLAPADHAGPSSAAQEPTRGHAANRSRRSEDIQPEPSDPADPGEGAEAPESKTAESSESVAPATGDSDASDSSTDQDHEHDTADSTQAVEAALVAPMVAPTDTPPVAPASPALALTPGLAENAVTGAVPPSSTGPLVLAPPVGTDPQQSSQPPQPAVNTNAPAHPAGSDTAATPATAHAHAQGQTASRDLGEFLKPGSHSNETPSLSQTSPDGSQLTGLHTRDFGQVLATTTHANAADPATRTGVAPVPLETLAVEIAARAKGGSNRFEIRLDPPELGRIEVRLDIDRSGQVTSRLVVERAETLDVLRRDAHQLERALQDAGLRTPDSGLQFTLRDQGFAHRNDTPEYSRVTTVEPDQPIADSAAVTYGVRLRSSGIDIRI